MLDSIRQQRHGLTARVLPRRAGMYPALKQDMWYRVRPDGPGDDGTCWLVGYGVKQRVLITDFEFRKAD